MDYFQVFVLLCQALNKLVQSTIVWVCNMRNFFMGSNTWKSLYCCFLFFQVVLNLFIYWRKIFFFYWSHFIFHIVLLLGFNIRVITLLYWWHFLNSSFPILAPLQLLRLLSSNSASNFLIQFLSFLPPIFSFLHEIFLKTMKHFTATFIIRILLFQIVKNIFLWIFLIELFFTGYLIWVGDGLNWKVLFWKYSFIFDWWLFQLTNLTL